MMRASWLTIRETIGEDAVLAVVRACVVCITLSHASKCVSIHKWSSKLMRGAGGSRICLRVQKQSDGLSRPRWTVTRLDRRRDRGKDAERIQFLEGERPGRDASSWA
jgi:hypothetical protein